MSEARSRSNTAPCRAAVFSPGREGVAQVTGGIDIRLAHRLPGKPAEGHAPHCPFDKLSWWKCSDLKVRTITSWGQRQVCRKASHVSRVEVKQALVEQGIYREQENSHPGWPDLTLHPYRPCTTLTVLVHPSCMISLGIQRYVEGHGHQIPQIHYGHQQLESINSKIPSMLRTVVCQDVGKFWSQALTRSMEMESMSAMPCPVIRKVRPPLVFTFTEGVLLMYWHVGKEDGESLPLPHCQSSPHGHISWVNFSWKSRGG